MSSDDKSTSSSPTSEAGPTSKAGRVNIVLVEDHIILRDGLRSLLNMESDFEVVGEADSCDKALEVVRAAQPDLLITDIGLPGRSGLTMIPEIKALMPKIRILVLTAHCTDEYVRAALEHGADGYVLKDASHAELTTGIRTVMAGQQYFSTPVTSRVISGFLGRSSPGGASESSRLTQREEEVLTMIASAFSNKEVAKGLNLSVKTVEKHRSNLMRKLGLRSAAAITLYAVRNNYVSSELDEPDAHDPSTDLDS
jgi:DNA-binding NarL/FixJ family response regulator